MYLACRCLSQHLANINRDETLFWFKTSLLSSSQKEGLPMLFSEMISFQVFLVQIKRHALGTTIILFFFLASNMMISTVLVGNTQVSAGAWCSWFMCFRLHTMKTGLKCLTLSLAPCHHFVPYSRKLYICLSLPKFLISGRNICSGYPWQGRGEGVLPFMGL